VFLGSQSAICASRTGFRGEKLVAQIAAPHARTEALRTGAERSVTCQPEDPDFESYLTRYTAPYGVIPNVAARVQWG
jgi:hypothetical protein